MQCPNCKTKVSKKARFCPECGKPIADGTHISVEQEVGKVKGTVVGQALDGDQLPSRSATTQKIDSVEKGGILVGASIGDGQQIGGSRQYGDTITVGDISGSTGIAVGKSVSVKVTQGISAEEITKVFAPLLQAVQTKPDSPEKEKAENALD